jgi:heme exporter protein D
VGIFCFEWFVWLGLRVCCCVCVGKALVCGTNFVPVAAAVCVGGVVIGVCHKITKDVQVLQGEARYRE